MPRPINRIFISGRLPQDPKIVISNKREEPLKIANFSLVFDWWNGKKLTHPWYFECVAFKYSADNVEKRLKKGSHILITEGCISTDNYTKKDGTKVRSVKIIVNDFVMVGYNQEVEGQNFDTAVEEMVSQEEEEFPEF